MRLASYFPLVAVSGARQAGKTTLLRECFDRYNYVCLDLPSKAEQAEWNPVEFLNENPPPLLVDEVQHAPALSFLATMQARKAGISPPADCVILDYALLREPVMNRIAWQDRVVIEEHIHHGDPCIKGTRIPVRVIIGSLADGMSGDEIRREYPQLMDEDIRAALAYAAELIDSEVLAPLTP